MSNLPPILKELFNAVAVIIEKLSMILTRMLAFLWGILTWLFERFVDLIRWIANIL